MLCSNSLTVHLSVVAAADFELPGCPVMTVCWLGVLNQFWLDQRPDALRTIQGVQISPGLPTSLTSPHLLSSSQNRSEIPGGGDEKTAARHECFQFIAAIPYLGVTECDRCIRVCALLCAEFYANSSVYFYSTTWGWALSCLGHPSTSISNCF